jgi:hypothetical protein
MSKASTLTRVIDDISRKDLGTARERLLSLLREYPNDLGLRHILGRIYLELQYPQAAGKYLYLVDDPSPDVQNAIKKFENYKKTMSIDVLKELRLSGHIDSIDDEYAKNKLLALLDMCSIKNGRFPKRKRRRSRTESKVHPGWIAAIIAGLLFLLTSVIWGGINFVRWIIELISELF